MSVKTYDSFSEFEHHILEDRHELGFQNWTVVQIHELTDEDKDSIKSVDLKGAKTACLVTAVRTTEEKSETFLVYDDNVSADAMKSRCLDSYLRDIDNRILGVDPGSINGFFAYDTWEEFKEVWLIRKGRVAIPHIMPILYDLPSDVEYVAWEKAGKIKLDHRRLIVTLYVYSKDRFYRLFIKKASKEEIEHFAVFLKAQKGMTTYA